MGSVDADVSSPEVNSPQTVSNLLALLVAPINSYLSVLTLLAIPSYTPLLAAQPYSTRLAIGQAVVSSVLKNNTAIETPEDVTGVLGLCAVLVRDAREPVKPGQPGGNGSAQGQAQSRGGMPDSREMAEEQGWVARMVHLFRNDDLAVQFEVSRPRETDPSTDGDSYCKRRGDTLQRAGRGYGTHSLHLSRQPFSSPAVSSSVNNRSVLNLDWDARSRISGVSYQPGLTRVGDRVGDAPVNFVQVHPPDHYSAVPPSRGSRNMPKIVPARCAGGR